MDIYKEPAPDTELTPATKESRRYAVYLGVSGYGTAQAADKPSFWHRFCIDGHETAYQISSAQDYAIQNLLCQGGVYHLTVVQRLVIAAVQVQPCAFGTLCARCPAALVVGGTAIPTTSRTVHAHVSLQPGGAVAPAVLTPGDTVQVYGSPAVVVLRVSPFQRYQAPVGGLPGRRTLKNFLACALEPVGTTLYLYGGGWNWQDTGSGRQSTSIGLPPAWPAFFQAQDPCYRYQDRENPAHSYYPHGGYNAYYYAGVDCSGYVGWAVYQVMHQESGGSGFVRPAVQMAHALAHSYGYGAWTQAACKPQDFHPGDIVSITGHVWICVGGCADGSLVILHSTPSDSWCGAPGGGVQLGALGSCPRCQAYRLIQKYLMGYYPAWSARYPAALRSYRLYTGFTGSTAGKFSWNMDETGLLDPDGYAAMTAEEILEDLFGNSAPVPTV